MASAGKTTATEVADDARIKRRAVVVLGMHRSGTSALARVLSLMGATLPSEMFPPAQDNPTGFWEPREVAAINDEILSNFDSEWDDVFAFKLNSSNSNFNQFYFSKAQEIIEKNYGCAELIVLKDPRISVLQPFWERVLLSCGYEPTYVVSVRHPQEIADSLLKRGGMPHKKAFLLWASYLISAAMNTRGKSRVFVAYDNLLDQPFRVIEKIEQAAGFSLPRHTSAAEIEIERFLSRDLRHHHYPVDSQLPWPWAAELYDWLLKAVNDEAPDEAELDKIKQELVRIEEVAGPTVADLKLHIRGLESKIRVAELKPQEHGLKSLLEETASELGVERDRVKEVTAQLHESEARFDKLIKEQFDLKSHLEELTAALTFEKEEREKTKSDVELTLKQKDNLIEQQSINLKNLGGIELEAEILRESNKQLKSHLAEAQNARLRDEVRADDAQLRADDAQNARLRAEAQVDEAEAKASEAQNARLRAEVRADEAQLRADDAQSARLRAEARVDEAEAKASEALNARLRAEVRADEAQMRADDAQSARLRAEARVDEAEAKASEALNACLRAEVRADEAQLRADDAQSARLRAEIRADKAVERAFDLSAVLARKILLLNEAERLVTEHSRTEHRLGEEIIHISKALDAEREYLNNQRILYESLEANLAVLEGEKISAKAEMASLDVALKDSQAKLALADNALSLRDNLIDTLKSQLAGRDTEFHNSAVKLMMAEQELIVRGKLIDTLAAESETAQLQKIRVQNALDDIQASTSWRVTAPVRSFLSRLRLLLAKAP